MMKRLRRFAGLVLALAITAPALALDPVQVEPSGDSALHITWKDSHPVDIALSDQPGPAKGLRIVSRRNASGDATVPVATHRRTYVLLRTKGSQQWQVFGERSVQLEKGSNFRDLGGFTGAGGKHVRWGAIYRSGAMPLLTDNDYALLTGLHIGSIIDLRSLEEREIAPDQLDDRTGALFLANDYSFRGLMAGMAGRKEYLYQGTELRLAPQYRMIFRRLLASDGAVLFHCSAGQDRTGVAAALVLSALGVDRKTIVEDYHRSTALRRPEFEMPEIDPAAFPGNPIVAYYATGRAKGGRPEPLYSASGVSHLVQFFEVLDRDYGGPEGYLKSQLGIGPAEIARLRALYLQ